MKLIKGLFKLIFGLIILVILVAGVAIYFVSDTNDIDEKYQDYSSDTTYEINSLISNSLKETSSTSLVDLSLTEEQLNYLFVPVTDSFNKSLPSNIAISGVEADIEEDNTISIKIYAKAYFFETSVKGNLTIQKSDTDLVLSVNNASVGKIKASNTTIGKILKLAFTEEQFTKALKDEGFDIEMSLDELKISIKLSELEEMLNKQFENDINNNLYKTLLEILFDNQLIDIVNSNDKLGLSLDLSDLSYSSENFYEIPYNNDYESVKTKVETLLNNNTITYDQTGKVFDYLVRGYEKIEAAEGYDFIKDLNLTSIGISNNENYDGILTYDEKTMLEIISEQLPNISSLLSSTFDFRIYASDINNILFKTGIVGTSYAFARKENNLYKVSYIYLESIYTKIVDDNLYLMISLNLNQKQIALKCSLQTSSSNGLCVKTDVKTIVFGDIALNETQIKSILSYLSTVTSEETWFKVNSDNKQISFDFTSMFSSNTVFQVFMAITTNTESSLVGNEDDGYIKISFDLTV